MTTSCECVSNIPNFCLLQGKFFGDAPKDKDKAIEAYTYCITETKRCLSFTENPVSKEKLCKQIAIGYNERGFMKYQKVDFDEAIADYSKALSYDSSLYFTYYNRGLIHYRLGRFDEAISDMKEALSIEPDFEPAKQCLKQAKVDKKPKAEQVPDHKSSPAKTNVSKEPLSSQESKGSLSSQESKGPLSSQESKGSLSSQESKGPLSSQESKGPLSSQQSKKPLSSQEKQEVT